MTCPPEPNSADLEAFAVHNPSFVTQTCLATIWKVQRKDGSKAALKCYADPAMPDERPGFALLDALAGYGAARLYAVHGGSALIEWLDGPSLGDIARAGAVEEADMRLVVVAKEIHRKPAKASADMPHLTDWFAALRTVKPPQDCSAETQHNVWRSQLLAEHLLENQSDIGPLHGDLHHDNVKISARGDLAVDAKGSVGDRIYELANGFLNPVGAAHITTSPARIQRLTRDWAQAFDTTPKTLLDWACAHAALSAAWHLRDGISADFAMLNLLWQVRDRSD